MIIPKDGPAGTPSSKYQSCMKTVSVVVIVLCRSKGQLPAVHPSQKSASMVLWSMPNYLLLWRCGCYHGLLPRVV